MGGIWCQIVRAVCVATLGMYSVLKHSKATLPEVYTRSLGGPFVPFRGLRFLIKVSNTKEGAPFIHRLLCVIPVQAWTW